MRGGVDGGQLGPLLGLWCDLTCSSAFRKHGDSRRKQLKVSGTLEFFRWGIVYLQKKEKKKRRMLLEWMVIQGGNGRQHLRKMDSEDDEANTLQARWLVAH